MVFNVCFRGGDAALLRSIRAVTLAQLGSVMDEVVAQGLREGVFYTRQPGGVGRLLLLLAHDVEDEAARLLIAGEGKPESVMAVIDNAQRLSRYGGTDPQRALRLGAPVRYRPRAQGLPGASARPGKNGGRRGMTRFCKRLLAALLGAALLGGAALGAPTPVPIAPLTTGESAGQTLPTERPWPHSSLTRPRRPNPPRRARSPSRRPTPVPSPHAPTLRRTRDLVRRPRRARRPLLPRRLPPRPRRTTPSPAFPRICPPCRPWPRANRAALRA